MIDIRVFCWDGESFNMISVYVEVLIKVLEVEGIWVFCVDVFFFRVLWIYVGGFKYLWVYREVVRFMCVFVEVLRKFFLFGEREIIFLWGVCFYS